MEIHAPIGPAHSFKDFAVHILIVTIGILIALGLEGARESWKENKAVSEARRSLDAELHLNRDQLRLEREQVVQANRDLDRLLANLPQLAKTPAELRSEVLKVPFGSYFYRTTVWDSALASGVLAHMEADELHLFDEAYLGVKNYQDVQKNTIPDWISVQAYFASHPAYTAAELIEGEERLRSLKIRNEFLEHVGDQFAAGLKSSIGEGN